ncbi:tRNA1(Val) (adenine(37)-N6)-methyltransferase [Lichenibacterium ramalinae]|uniref:tRNA1(Val) (adenine(37)-N6)-methyltransferase n=1 Tax=Lichenibacterium ramalinae TaxID=2316527 RepID=UPI001FE23A4C|nr:methyltransferase [Lichenibacterium ramalinae]
MGEPVADRLLGGRLTLLQRPGGHRAGTDAVLLAAAADAPADGHFVDVGSGVGSAGLMLARRCPGARGLLVEVDGATAALARRNCVENGLAERVEVVEADLFARAADRPAALAPERAALVLTNPPFFAREVVRASPDADRARAHVLGGQGHGDWLAACVALLAPRGRFVTIHRPDALPELLAACTGRLGALVLRPVLARPGGDAIRILLAGTKGSRAPLRLAPPFVLHGPDGAFTPEAEAVHRGEAAVTL